MSRFNKSTVMLGGAALVISLTLGACSSSGAASPDNVSLRFGSVLAEAHPMTVHGVHPFIEQVEEESQGGVTFQQFSDGTLAAAGEDVAAQRNDVFDAFFIYAGYEPTEMPLNQVWSLPLGWTGPEQMAVMWRMLHEDTEVAAELQDIGIVPLMTFTSPAYDFQTADSPLEGLEDLKGLRLRAPSSIAREIMTAVGASPVELASSETYEGINRGTVDGTYYYYAGWPDFSLEELLHHSTHDLKTATTGLDLVGISLEDWEQLTDQQKTILYKAGRDQTMAVQKALMDEDDQMRERFEADGSLKTYTWPEQEVAEFQALMTGVVDDWVERAEASDYPAADVVQEIRSTLEEVRAEEDLYELPDYDPLTF